MNGLSIRIVTNRATYEGSITTRQINELFFNFINPKLREITIGKWSTRKDEILDINVFIRADKINEQ
ncbi:MAG TPA: hypothetical protein VJ583_03520 [Nitrososphaeraceae archaeon]|nr:hypothetical protein [Nitrososphaeraceae archaeon]